MKAGKEHVVPLSDAALAVLEQMVAVRSGPFVFQGSRGHLSSESMRKVLQRMGDGDLTGHGFRSTFRDWAGDCTAFDRETIEFVLAHGVSGATEAAYRRGTALEKRRRLMTAWAEYCQFPERVGVPGNSDVVKLRA